MANFKAKPRNPTKLPLPQRAHGRAEEIFVGFRLLKKNLEAETTSDERGATKGERRKKSPLWGFRGPAGENSRGVSV